jgi:flagellar basal body-associated protein FliL
MADKTDEEVAAEAAAAKKKKMMMIGGGLLAAVAVYRFVLAPPAEVPETLASTEDVVEEIAEGEIIAIPEMTLNLAESPGDGQLHYARIGLAVVLQEGVDPVIGGTKMPLVQDVVVDVVSLLTFEDLRVTGALQELKAEVSARAREAFDGEMVSRVIFTSFVVQ